MRVVRLLGLICVTSLQRELAHRANLAFAGVVALVNAGAGVATLAIVFGHTSTLAGWHIGAALALLGAYQIVSGLLEACIEPNLAWLGGKVSRGELDEVLLQPAPSLLMASLGSLQPWALLQTALGGVTLAVGIAHLNAVVTPGAALASLALLLAGVVITWATRVMLASLAFWSPSLALDVFYGAVWQLGRYPVSVYHPIAVWVLTYVIPLAFVATIPAQALAHGADLALVGQGLVAAAVFAGAATAVWHAGLRRYTSATS